MFLILDAGTGGGKCVIFDERGTLRGAHRERWTYDLHVHPDVPFVKEFSFSAPAFWDILCRCVHQAMAQAGIAPADVIGISTTSQREGCVFLDAGGNEIYAGPNIDARGFNEGFEVLDALGNERLYGITGHSAPFIFPLARYLWFRKHGAGTVAHLLMINDWMTYRLSGALTAEPSNATESMLFDLDRRTWSDEILTTFDIPREILPPVYRCGERAGELTAAAAAATGLLAGTPVFVGGADTQCSLLGAGAVEPGATGATLGTTTPVQTVTERALFDPAGNLWVGCHVLPDRWVLESNAGDTGDAYLWLLDLVAGGTPRDQVHALADRLAAEAFGPPTMLFVGPTVFNILHMRFNRPGGMLFPFPALHVRPDRGTLIRAFMESIGYALRGNMEQLAAVTGRTADALTLSGGLSRSATLPRVIADVTGLPALVAHEAESAALGCAMLAMASVAQTDVAAAVSGMLTHRRIDPDAAQQARYAGPYARWRALNAQLDDIELQ